MNLTEQEINEALELLIDKGMIVVVGYDENGEAMYMDRQAAEENNVKFSTLLN